MVAGRRLGWRVLVVAAVGVSLAACAGTRVDASGSDAGGVSVDATVGDAQSEPGVTSSSGSVAGVPATEPEGTAGVDAFGAVAVLVDDGSGPKRHCTGVAVAPNTVVTAAHCVAAFDPASIRVEVPGGTVHGVDSRVADPRYGWTESGIRDDYALLTSVDELATATVGLVGDSRGPYVGPATVVSVRGELDHLEVVTTRVVAGDNKRCLMAGPPVMFDPRLMVCVNGSGAGFCRGDSGSPVLVDEPDGTRALAGVLTAGYGCGGDEPVVGIAAATTGYGATWLRHRLAPR